MLHPDPSKLSVNPGRHGTGTPGTATYDSFVAGGNLKLGSAANLPGTPFDASYLTFLAAIESGDPGAIADAQDAGDLDADGEWIPYDRSY